MNFLGHESFQRGRAQKPRGHTGIMRDRYEDLDPLRGLYDWVAVKELKLSYYIGETLLFTIYTHYGNLM